MCEFCPDDLSDLETHRQAIRAWEERIHYLMREVETAKREVQGARDDLRRRLREGHIRNA